MIIPVGRLAIDAFIGPLPLDEVVGREFVLESSPGAAVVPLPHPSGASSWIHAPGHTDLLDRALGRIARRWSGLYGRRRAA